MIVGIDLGTTNSAIGYLSETGPRLIPNAVGGLLTPSVIGVDEENQILVGQAAKELQVTQPQRCAALFKRLMGSDTPTTIGSRTFSPEQLSSLVLRSLKQDAAAHLQQPIERAVISVPAYFNEHQRKATLNAGRLAGLDVVRIVNEPTAAAIAYGMHQLTQTLRLVVLDLGGGTFDVSVVDLFEGMLEVRASCGESFLGGEDFTRTLAAQLLARRGHVFERIEQQAPKLVARTIQQAELAKRALSREESAFVRIANEGGELAPDSPGVQVTRMEFEQWTSSLLARIELPIRRALGDANCKPNSCDQVLLVGGATRMPMLRRRAEEIFGRAPRCDLNPDEVVALGASLQAGLLEQHRAVGDVVVTDVAPFTLGVEITHRVGHELRDGYFLPLINRNTTIPVSRVERVFTVEPNQHHVRVAVYQGEARRVQDNTLLAEFMVDRLPPGGARGNQGLDIRFTYDLNGVLEVEVTVVSTGKKHQHVVTRHAKGLSPEQLQAALARMAELKLQPREEAAAQLLIRRAERLYQEIPLDAREQLNYLLGAFEHALAESDKAGLEEMRTALEQFLSAWDAPPDADD